MRSPKQPLPPRLSQPDGYEVQARALGGNGSAAREQIEPESLFDDTHQDETRPALADEAKVALEIAARKRSATPPNPNYDKDAETAAMAPNDFHKALAQLQRNRDSGQPAPPPPASRPSPQSQSGTGPNMMRRQSTGNDLDVPSAKDLAARVARRSLASVPPPASQPPPAPAVPQPEASEQSVLNALLGGVVPSATSNTGGTAPFNMNGLGLKPATGGSLSPQRTPSPIAVVSGSSIKPMTGGKPMTVERPQTGPAPFAPFNQVKTSPSSQAPPRPGGNSPSRMPPAAMQAAANQGRPMNAAPAKQYDFKRWSSPDFSEMPDDGKPVTFQVYTPQDVANGRAPMRSLPMIEPPAKKATNIVLKIFLAIIGLVIVLITAGAVILVSQDDPKRPNVPVPTPTDSVLLAPTDTAPAPSVVTPPPAITIGDPAPPDDSASAAPPPPTKPPKPGAAHPAVQEKPAPAPQPSSLKAVTPPPNPYGK